MFQAPDWEAIIIQAGLAIIYYSGLITIMRLAGKRLAGQTTTFDLIVLISRGVVLQSSLLKPGFLNALVFIAVVFSLHKSLALLAAQHPFLRSLLRGKPKPLVKDGKMMTDALQAEGIGEEELQAGLRKQGFFKIEDVKLAVLEETGHITATAKNPAPSKE